MRTLLTIITLFIAGFISQAQNSIQLSDFESLNNTHWTGTLTYTDYQSGDLKTVDATMQFEIKGDKILTQVQYTYEPSKNYKGSIKIRKNGTYFGNEKVVSFSDINGTKILVTTYQGKDGGKKADMIMTHTITDSTYSVSKEVVYLDTKERLIRNTYNYTKIN